jgi:HD-GYP domain-containing protein (c-di-GMP phosphodiesterase class II)
MNEQFLPVALATLQFERAAPCDLYRCIRDEQYVFFAKKGVLFDRAKRDRVIFSGADRLYIREEERALYSAYLKETLVSIVNDPAVSSDKKAQAVHTACLQTLQRTFEEPRAVFLAQACEILEPTVNLIVSDDQATRHLIHLTTYDHSTYVHSTNVGIFSIALARILFSGDKQHNMQALGAGFFLHDLGKCKIPIEILNKPGMLTDEEREIVQRHVLDGYQMVESSGLMTDEARTIILQHHERDDGRGYPNGKRAEEIHPYARICRLADVYEALTADRPYHNSRSSFEALKFMKEHVVSGPDEQVFAGFVKLFLA